MNMMNENMWKMKSTDGVFSFFFKTSLCTPVLYLFDKKYSKNSNIVKYHTFEIAVFYRSHHLKCFKKVNQSCPKTSTGIVLVLGQL